MWGETLGKPIEFTVCNKRSGEFKTVPASVPKGVPSNNKADFFFVVADGPDSAVVFGLSYVSEATIGKINLHGVCEPEVFKISQSFRFSGKKLHRPVCIVLGVDPAKSET